MFWKEAYYQYIALPNGFSPIVRVFTKVLTPQFKYLRSKGHLSIKYIAKSLLLGETFEICFNNIRATVALLRELGFTIHPEKSVLVPIKQIIFLGFVIDSEKMTITLTEEINSLELQAAFFYLKTFCKNKTRLHVLLKLDNTTAVAYINKEAGTNPASCNKLAKDIWNWAKGQDIWTTASHVSGVKNTTGDLRSRLF